MPCSRTLSRLRSSVLSAAAVSTLVMAVGLVVPPGGGAQAQTAPAGDALAQTRSDVQVDAEVLAQAQAAARADAMRAGTAGLAGAYLAARNASGHNDYAAAARYYAQALELDPGNPLLLESAILAYAGMGKIERAVPVATDLVELGLDSQIANMILLADDLGAGRFEQALDALRGDRSVGPLVDGLSQAWLEVALGDLDAAMEAFDASTRSTGLDAFGAYHKGLAQAVEGNFEAADAILSGDEGAAPPLTRRGVIAHVQVLSQLDRNDEAIALIAESFGPDMDPGIGQMLAKLEAGETLPFDLLRDGKDGLAEVFYSVASALRGEASDSYTLLYSRVAEHLRANFTDAYLLTGALLDAQDRHDLAINAYARVSPTDPSYHIAEIGRAEALRAGGDPDGAIAVLRQLALTRPDLTSVHITLGDMLRSEEHYADAVTSYDRAIDLLDQPEPGHWIVFYARGIANERTGHWPQAEADLRRALELNPGQPQVQNYLGYSFLEKGDNIEEAMELIEQAVAARPDDGYITDSLGWGLYLLGDYDQAIGLMERAAELMPVDPIVNDHLGDVLWAVGRKTEAEFQWHRALSFDPEPEDATRIRRKLEVGLDAVLAEEGEEPLSTAQRAD